jgi:hypothetical protein
MKLGESCLAMHKKELRQVADKCKVCLANVLIKSDYDACKEG